MATRLELSVLVATYRNETKDLINREGTKEAVAEFIRNTDRAEETFKRNEGKSE